MPLQEILPTTTKMKLGSGGSIVRLCYEIARIVSAYIHHATQLPLVKRVHLSEFHATKTQFLERVCGSLMFDCTIEGKRGQPSGQLHKIDPRVPIKCHLNTDRQAEAPLEEVPSKCGAKVLIRKAGVRTVCSLLSKEAFLN